MYFSRIGLREIEALEEAALQLRKHTATGDRLALVLTDNIIELAMFFEADYRFEYDRLFPSVKSPKFNEKMRREVREHFDKKVSFLVQESGISEDDGNFIKVAHKLRNESYHKGILREDVLPFIAKTYFGIACKCLVKFFRGSYASSTDRSTVSLKKYGIAGSMVMSQDNMQRICDMLMDSNTCSIREHAEALSENVMQVVDGILDGIKYHPLYGREGITKDHVLKMIQFWEIAPEKYGCPRSCEEARKIEEEFFPGFKAPYTMRRIDRIKYRANLLKADPLPGSALQKYHELYETLQPLDYWVQHLVWHVEEEIDAEIKAIKERRKPSAESREA